MSGAARATDAGGNRALDIASTAESHIPAPEVLWRGFRFWTWAAFLFFGLAAVPDILVQFWFNQSLGYRTIFWTNLLAQASVLACFGGALFAAIAIPPRLHRCSGELKRAALHVGAWVGLIGGALMARHYGQFLLAIYGVPFDAVDPVFGADIGFYVYVLPAIRLVFVALEVVLLLAAASLVLARYGELEAGGALVDSTRRFGDRARLFASPSMQALVYGAGVVLAVQTFFTRYGLLLKDNEPSGVRAGAD